MLPPLIERELRIAMHGREVAKARFRIALIGAGLVAGVLIVAFAIGGREAGRQLQHWLFLFALYSTMGPALAISAGLLAEERRDRTLELLFLTGISSMELFIGKLIGAAVAASAELLALVPLLAVPFLCGGVTGDLYLATIVCFPVLFLFTLAAGILGSAMCTDEGAAQVLAISAIASLSLAVPIVYNLGIGLNGTPPFSAMWLSVSPAAGPYMVWRAFSVGSPAAFGAAMAVSIGWALVFIIAAAVVLKRNWRRDMERSAAGDSGGIRSALTRGTPAGRIALRQRLLAADNAPWPPPMDIPETEIEAQKSRTAYERLVEYNRKAAQGRSAYQWLVERDRRAISLAWIAIGGISGIWLLGWAAWPRAWPSCANFFTTAVVLILATGWARRQAAARRLAEDRRDGALELLLTTPLQPEEIVDGQLSALASQFRPVHRTVAALFVLIMAAGIFTRPWTIGALVSYFLAWTFLLSVTILTRKDLGIESMWIAVNSGRPLYSVMRNYLGPSPWVLLINLYNLRNIADVFGGGAARFPTGSTPELAILIIGIVFYGCVCLFQAGNKAITRSMLTQEMRSIAVTPVPDPKDPRFKKWKTTERFRPTLPARK